MSYFSPLKTFSMKTAIKVQNFSIKTHILKIFSAKIYFFVIFFFVVVKKRKRMLHTPSFFPQAKKKKRMQ